MLPRYGVLSGTLTRTVRDTPDSQGRWFHVSLFVNAAGVEFRCAVDIDSHQSNTGVEWRLVHVSAADVAAMLALLPGYHDLQHTPCSGAWDYTRAIQRARSGGMRTASGRTPVRWPNSRMVLGSRSSTSSPRSRTGPTTRGIHCRSRRHSHAPRNTRSYRGKRSGLSVNKASTSSSVR